ncbi:MULTISPECIES: PaaI family thioesterase [Salipiger]|uniref:Thioesterase family protein n=1 Tax=Salipiger bermudensis (strain DSM 26914 / JCM 13377 / KCTC 12554 / HTCC2601) TaxID=314265 RepID=Q0FJL8_SALBH|nr:PaaI family thioesterase [Salipiger bermudensis]EAU44419.1 thioesterase family protein [Salipiger bermudensis HTCC2601]MBN9674932.1 PaaI family thioesterase [Salipiger bermudensis]MBR9891573.1 PaaI family thioesterase [bacterium]MCA1284545.1 PaaI family thioesterase [Salipiger bermudensis]
MQVDKTELAREFINLVPQARALQLEITEIHDGIAVIRMPYDPALVGDPDTGVIHGGAVSTLMDTCGGAATMSHPSNPGGTATISLRIDYLRAATPGQAIVARAECHHVTRSVAFVRATAHDDDPDNPVATATGTFTVEGAT